MKTKNDSKCVWCKKRFDWEDSGREKGRGIHDECLFSARYEGMVPYSVMYNLLAEKSRGKRRAI
jgi:hypothetical protein